MSHPTHTHTEHNDNSSGGNHSNNLQLIFSAAELSVVKKKDQQIGHEKVFFQLEKFNIL